MAGVHRIAADAAWPVRRRRERTILPRLLHPFSGLFSRTSSVSRCQEGKTSLDLNEARDNGVWGCRSISWTTCKQSAPRSRQRTAPTPHHSTRENVIVKSDLRSDAFKAAVVATCAWSRAIRLHKLCPFSIPTANSHYQLISALHTLIDGFTPPRSTRHHSRRNGTRSYRVSRIFHLPKMHSKNPLMGREHDGAICTDLLREMWHWCKTICRCVW